MLDVSESEFKIYFANLEAMYTKGRVLARQDIYTNNNPTAIIKSLENISLSTLKKINLWNLEEAPYRVLCFSNAIDNSTLLEGILEAVYSNEDLMLIKSFMSKDIELDLKRKCEKALAIPEIEHLITMFYYLYPKEFKDMCLNAFFTTILSRKLKLFSAKKLNIFISSLLQDCGLLFTEYKSADSFYIDHEDWKSYKRHPILASKIAEKVPELSEEVATIVIEHHESKDNTGFPQGMIKHELLVESRVLHISSIILRHLKQESSVKSIIPLINIYRKNYDEELIDMAIVMLKRAPIRPLDDLSFLQAFLDKISVKNNFIHIWVTILNVELVKLCSLIPRDQALPLVITLSRVLYLIKSSDVMSPEILKLIEKLKANPALDTESTIDVHVVNVIYDEIIWQLKYLFSEVRYICHTQTQGETKLLEMIEIYAHEIQQNTPPEELRHLLSEKLNLGRQSPQWWMK